MERIGIVTQHPGCAYAAKAPWARVVGSAR